MTAQRRRFKKCVINFVSATSFIFIIENIILLLRFRHHIVGDSSTDDIDAERLNCSVKQCNVNQSQPSFINNVEWTFPSYPENDEEKQFYKLGKRLINPYPYGFLINGSNICDKNTTVIILIHSILRNIDKRKAIRSTWGSVAKGSTWPHNRPINGNLRLAFVFGQRPNWTDELLKEDQQYGGIIQGNFVDAYNNLTLKSLLGFKWVIEFCPNVSYLLKSDDDMFINIPYLLNILAAREPLRRTVVGPLSLGSRVYRQGKWKMSKDLYPFPKYPPYESGSSYVITADIIGELFEAAKYVPQIFIDDVFITGILGRTLGINHAKQYGFAFMNTKIPTVCDILLDKIITAHRLSGDKLLTMWKKIYVTNKAQCKK